MRRLIGGEHAGESVFSGDQEVGQFRPEHADVHAAFVVAADDALGGVDGKGFAD